MSDWQPTPLEVMSAMTFVLSEEPVPSDALYILGSQADKDLDAREIKTAADLYKLGFIPRIVVHGATIEEVSRSFDLTDYGVEFLKAELMKFGVPEKDILATPSSYHTAGELKNLLRMAQERGWGTITIMAYPHHQLRCFLQIIALMEETGVRLKVYNKSFWLGDIDWKRPIKRPVHKGQNILGLKDIDAPMYGNIAAEYERVVKYAQDPASSGQKYTRHATIPEMFHYISERDT